MAKKILFWAVTLIVIAAALVGLAYWGQKSTGTDTTVNEEVSVIKSDDQVAGNRTSKVVLVEYGDFQCPACASFEPTIVQLLKDQGDKFALVFRHFPLIQTHKNAQLASQASEAAGKQGKFWEYHDLLYKNQTIWASISDPTATFTEYAKTLSLNEAQFVADMQSDAAKERVNRDASEGLRYDVNSTPTFYLNGKKLTLRSFDELKLAVEQAIGSPQ